MNRDRCYSPIRVAEEKVTSPAADDFKPKPTQDPNELLTLETRKASHTEIC